MKILREAAWERTNIKTILLAVFILNQNFQTGFGQIFNILESVLPQISPALRTDSGLQFRQRVVLNQSTNSVLEWQVNRSARTITFNFSTTATNESILLLGLSRSGHVENADVVAFTNVRFDSTEAVNLTDMHGSSNTTISRDSVQNWRLLTVQRSSSLFSATISRSLDTCDQQDVSINTDMLRIIWGSSNTSSTNGSIQFTPQGNIRVYLTDPMVTPPEEAQNGLQSWRVSRQFHIPPRHTSYWCSIHRGPQLLRKHHIVRHVPFFRDELSRLHVHHQLVYRCTAPPGIDPALIFDKYVNHPGEECYLEDNHELPTVFCSEILHTWGVGGNTFTFPNDIGMSIGETRNEYFMLESHYDNPESRADLMVENGVDLQYTSTLRPNEGGIIFVGTGVLGLFQVPPQATNFTVAGHCSPECTQQMLPREGMEIVATMLHAHMASRQVTLKNYRGNQELPWVQHDGNYDFSFQQMRLLPEPVRVLPGDQMTNECKIDTTSRNGTTLAGFATRDEMCITFFVIKKQLPYLYCSSEYPTERTIAKYGVKNMTWSREGQERIVNEADNPAFVGLPLSQVIDESVENWSPEMIDALEREQLYETHNATCPAVQRMIMRAYALIFAKRITGGLITVGDRIESQRPSIRAMSTPPASDMTIRYPVNARSYSPTPRCEP